MTSTCFVSEARGHQISSDFYAQGRFLLCLERQQLIHKNYTQLALWNESFDFLPTHESARLVKFVLAVFHHGFQKYSWSSPLQVVLQNLFSKFYTLLETNSYQKLTILKSPTNLAEEEVSVTKQSYHRLICPQSNPADSSVKEGDCFYLLCVNSMKYSLLPFILLKHLINESNKLCQMW